MIYRAGDGYRLALAHPRQPMYHRYDGHYGLIGPAG